MVFFFRSMVFFLRVMGIGWRIGEDSRPTCFCPLRGCVSLAVLCWGWGWLAGVLNKEQVELIGSVLDLRLKAVVAEMRLATKEEGEKVREAMDTTIKELRVEMKDEVRQQSKYFCWVIGGLVAIWLAAATLAVNKWPQATPVAPAAPVAQAAPVTPAEPPGLSQP